MIEPGTVQRIARHEASPDVHSSNPSTHEASLPSNPDELLLDIQAHVDALRRSPNAAPDRSDHLAAIRADVGRIREFVDELSCVTPDASEPARSEPHSPTSVTAPLTRREIEVLRLIGRGHTRKQIAASLFLSVKTIDAHQSHILRKLGVESRMELMRFAIREGLAQA